MNITVIVNIYLLINAHYPNISILTI